MEAIINACITFSNPMQFPEYPGPATEAQQLAAESLGRMACAMEIIASWGEAFTLEQAKTYLDELSEDGQCSLRGWEWEAVQAWIKKWFNDAPDSTYFYMPF